MPNRYAERIAGYSMSAAVLALSQENRRFLSCHGQIKCKSFPPSKLPPGEGDGIVVEIAGAVGLRPQPDLARDRLGKLVVDIEFPVHVGLQLGAFDHDLEVI